MNFFNVGGAWVYRSYCAAVSIQVSLQGSDDLVTASAAVDDVAGSQFVRQGTVLVLTYEAVESVSTVGAFQLVTAFSENDISCYLFHLKSKR